MILGFMQHFVLPGTRLHRKPTKFKQQILHCVKLHTMRVDAKKRWKPGMLIQLAHGVRTKFYDNFATFPCISTQEVHIAYVNGNNVPDVIIDGRTVGILEMTTLAANDGFESLYDFFLYFNENAGYTLIHWTPLRYDRGNNIANATDMETRQLKYKMFLQNQTTKQ